MATLTLTLPDALKAHVDAQVEAGAWPSAEAYLRALVERDRDADRLRALIQEGIESGPAEPYDEDELFAWLDDEIRNAGAA